MTFDHSLVPDVHTLGSCCFWLRDVFLYITSTIRFLLKEVDILCVVIWPYATSARNARRRRRCRMTL